MIMRRVLGRCQHKQLGLALAKWQHVHSDLLKEKVAADLANMSSHLGLTLVNNLFKRGANRLTWIAFRAWHQAAAEFRDAEIKKSECLKRLFKTWDAATTSSSHILVTKFFKMWLCEVKLQKQNAKYHLELDSVTREREKEVAERANSIHFSERILQKHYHRSLSRRFKLWVAFYQNKNQLDAQKELQFARVVQIVKAFTSRSLHKAWNSWRINAWKNKANDSLYQLQRTMLAKVCSYWRGNLTACAWRQWVEMTYQERIVEAAVDAFANGLSMLHDFRRHHHASLALRRWHANVRELKLKDESLRLLQKYCNRLSRLQRLRAFVAWRSNLVLLCIAKNTSEKNLSLGLHHLFRLFKDWSKHKTKKYFEIWCHMQKTEQQSHLLQAARVETLNRILRVMTSNTKICQMMKAWSNWKMSIEGSKLSANYADLLRHQVLQNEAALTSHLRAEVLEKLNCSIKHRQARHLTTAYWKWKQHVRDLMLMNMSRHAQLLRCLQARTKRTLSSSLQRWQNMMFRYQVEEHGSKVASIKKQLSSSKIYGLLEQKYIWKMRKYYLIWRGICGLEERRYLMQALVSKTLENLLRRKSDVEHILMLSKSFSAWHRQALESRTDDRVGMIHKQAKYELTSQSQHTGSCVLYAAVKRILSQKLLHAWRTWRTFLLLELQKEGTIFKVVSCTYLGKLKYSFDRWKDICEEQTILLDHLAWVTAKCENKYGNKMKRKGFDAFKIHLAEETQRAEKVYHSLSKVCNCMTARNQTSQLFKAWMKWKLKLLDPRYQATSVQFLWSVLSHRSYKHQRKAWNKWASVVNDMRLQRNAEEQKQRIVRKVCSKTHFRHLLRAFSHWQKFVLRTQGSEHSKFLQSSLAMQRLHLLFENTESKGLQKSWLKWTRLVSRLERQDLDSRIQNWKIKKAVKLFISNTKGNQLHQALQTWKAFASERKRSLLYEQALNLLCPSSAMAQKHAQAKVWRKWKAFAYQKAKTSRGLKKLLSRLTKPKMAQGFWVWKAVTTQIALQKKLSLRNLLSSLKRSDRSMQRSRIQWAWKQWLISGMEIQKKTMAMKNVTYYLLKHCNLDLACSFSRWKMRILFLKLDQKRSQLVHEVNEQAQGEHSRLSAEMDALREQHREEARRALMSKVLSLMKRGSVCAAWRKWFGEIRAAKDAEEMKVAAQARMRRVLVRMSHLLLHQAFVEWKLAHAARVMEDVSKKMRNAKQQLAFHFLCSALARLERTHGSKILLRAFCRWQGAHGLAKSNEFRRQYLLKVASRLMQKQLVLAFVQWARHSQTVRQELLKSRTRRFVQGGLTLQQSLFRHSAHFRMQGCWGVWRALVQSMKRAELLQAFTYLDGRLKLQKQQIKAAAFNHWVEWKGLFEITHGQQIRAAAYLNKALKGLDRLLTGCALRKWQQHTVKACAQNQKGLWMICSMIKDRELYELKRAFNTWKEKLCRQSQRQDLAKRNAAVVSNTLRRLLSRHKTTSLHRSITLWHLKVREATSLNQLGQLKGMSSVLQFLGSRSQQQRARAWRTWKAALIQAQQRQLAVSKMLSVVNRLTHKEIVVAFDDWKGHCWANKMKMLRHSHCQNILHRVGARITKSELARAFQKWMEEMLAAASARENQRQKVDRQVSMLHKVLSRTLFHRQLSAFQLWCSIVVKQQDHLDGMRLLASSLDRSLVTQTRKCLRKWQLATVVLKLEEQTKNHNHQLAGRILADKFILRIRLSFFRWCEFTIRVETAKYFHSILARQINRSNKLSVMRAWLKLKSEAARQGYTSQFHRTLHKRELDSKCRTIFKMLNASFNRDTAKAFSKWLKAVSDLRRKSQVLQLSSRRLLCAWQLRQQAKAFRQWTTNFDLARAGDLLKVQQIQQASAKALYSMKRLRLLTAWMHWKSVNNKLRLMSTAIRNLARAFQHTNRVNLSHNFMKWRISVYKRETAISVGRLCSEKQQLADFIHWHGAGSKVAHLLQCKHLVTMHRAWRKWTFLGLGEISQRKMRMEGIMKILWYGNRRSGLTRRFSLWKLHTIEYRLATSAKEGKQYAFLRCVAAAKLRESMRAAGKHTLLRAWRTWCGLVDERAWKVRACRVLLIHALHFEQNELQLALSKWSKTVNEINTKYSRALQVFRAVIDHKLPLAVAKSFRKWKEHSLAKKMQENMAIQKLIKQIHRLEAKSKRELQQNSLSLWKKKAFERESKLAAISKIQKIFQRREVSNLSQKWFLWRMIGSDMRYQQAQQEYSQSLLKKVMGRFLYGLLSSGFYTWRQFAKGESSSEAKIRSMQIRLLNRLIHLRQAAAFSTWRSVTWGSFFQEMCSKEVQSRLRQFYLAMVSSKSRCDSISLARGWHLWCAKVKEAQAERTQLALMHSLENKIKEHDAARQMFSIVTHFIMRKQRSAWNTWICWANEQHEAQLVMTRFMSWIVNSQRKAAWCKWVQFCRFDSRCKALLQRCCKLVQNQQIRDMYTAFLTWKDQVKEMRRNKYAQAMFKFKESATTLEKVMMSAQTRRLLMAWNRWDAGVRAAREQDIYVMNQIFTGATLMQKVIKHSDFKSMSRFWRKLHVNQLKESRLLAVRMQSQQRAVVIFINAIHSSMRRTLFRALTHWHLVGTFDAKSEIWEDSFSSASELSNGLILSRMIKILNSFYRVRLCKAFSRWNSQATRFKPFLGDQTPNSVRYVQNRLLVHALQKQSKSLSLVMAFHRWQVFSDRRGHELEVGSLGIARATRQLETARKRLVLRSLSQYWGRWRDRVPAQSTMDAKHIIGANLLGQVLIYRLLRKPFRRWQQAAMSYHLLNLAATRLREVEMKKGSRLPARVRQLMGLAFFHALLGSAIAFERWRSFIAVSRFLEMGTTSPNPSSMKLDITKRKMLQKVMNTQTPRRSSVRKGLSTRKKVHFGEVPTSTKKKLYETLEKWSQYDSNRGIF